MNRSQAGSRGVRLAQVVYEERNRRSGRQQPLTQYHTRNNRPAVRRAHKQSEARPSQQDSHARTSRGQRPLPFDDAIDVSTQSRARGTTGLLLYTARRRSPPRPPLARQHESVGLAPSRAWVLGPASRRAAWWGCLGSVDSVRMTSRGLSEIELGEIVLVCFLIPLFSMQAGMSSLSCEFSKGNVIETTYHVPSHRVPRCRYCQVEQKDPRDRWQVTREEEHRFVLANQSGLMAGTSGT